MRKSTQGGEETKGFWELQLGRQTVERESWRVREVSSEKYFTASALNGWEQLY